MRAYLKKAFFISLCATFATVNFSFAYAQTLFPTDITSSINQFPTTTQQQIKSGLEALKEAAQSAGIEQYITLSSNPKYPKAYETVTVSIEGFSNEVGAAEIEWRINGARASQGKGQKNFSFKTGTLGSVFNIEAVIDTGSGAHIEKSVTFSASDVDLLWEANSYVPPFYKGKALYPLQGTVVITALPSVFENGSKVSTKNLLYTWKKDGLILGSLSGYGKNTLAIEGTFIGSSVSVSVEVSSSGGAKAAGAMSVKPQLPEVLLYEESPLYGVRLESALKSAFTMKEKETTILSIPYFFNLSEIGAGALVRTWALNGKTIEGREKEEAVTFRQPEEAGSSQVSVTIDNPSKVLQSAQGTMTLRFNKTNTQ